MTLPIFDMNKFYKDGGTIQFLGNKDSLSKKLDGSEIQLESFLHKFLFYDKEGNIIKDVYGKDLVLDDNPVDFVFKCFKIIRV